MKTKDPGNTFSSDRNLILLLFPPHGAGEEPRMLSGWSQRVRCRFKRHMCRLKRHRCRFKRHPGTTRKCWLTPYGSHHLLNKTERKLQILRCGVAREGTTLAYGTSLALSPFMAGQSWEDAMKLGTFFSQACEIKKPQIVKEIQMNRINELCPAKVKVTRRKGKKVIASISMHAG